MKHIRYYFDKLRNDIKDLLYPNIVMVSWKANDTSPVVHYKRLHITMCYDTLTRQQIAALYWEGASWDAIDRIDKEVARMTGQPSECSYNVCFPADYQE